MKYATIMLIIIVRLIVNWVAILFSLPSPQLIHCPHLFWLISLFKHAIVEGAEVVNNGELIIINFIDADIADYRKVAFVVLTALVPSITISDITLARSLSLLPSPVQ